LTQIPFAALYSSETHRYLVEDHPLVVNPSASVMAQALAISGSKRAGMAESFLGVGNPRFSHQRFPDLPGLPSAEEEVMRVKPNYPNAQILSRDEATESALNQRIGNFEIVHFATHVIVNEQFPLLSSIVLAEENRRTPGDQGNRRGAFDGSLQAFEIYQLKLAKTRLVLLSGCRSALGSYSRGEALSGLAQAFLAASVPSVIASLWDIDDESTSGLMRAFHYQYRVKHQNFSESLRQAQFALIHGADTRRRHPYYWAAFLLAGNGCDGPLKN
jgi:CHAT domain-containing protein